MGKIDNIEEDRKRDGEEREEGQWKEGRREEEKTNGWIN